MNTSIIILAHGNQERWLPAERAEAHYKSKHLLPVRNQPLLKRTIELFKPYGDIFVYAWGWYEEWIDYPCLTIQPVKSLLNGILQTRDHWGDRTIFLLGDVLFSRSAVSTIVEKSKSSEILFFGRPHPNTVSGKRASELFSFTMTEENWDQVISHCEFMTVPTGSPKNLKYPPKLWSLYRLLCGNECHQDIIDLNLLWVINDYTDDVDSPEAFERFWGKMVEAEKRDD